MPMSGYGRSRFTDGRMRTRLVMVGAVVGALAVLSLSMAFSWPVPPGGGETSQHRDDLLAAFDSPAGSCLTWPPDNPRNMRRVDCAEPHMFEVTSNVDISGDYGPNAAPPGEQDWYEISSEECTEGAVDYLGGKLDPYGKYVVGALKPTDEQWRASDRKLRCGLQRRTLGAWITTTGTAVGQDQSNVHEPGTCFAIEENEVGGPVDCVELHASEVVGNVDLGKAFPGGFPKESRQQTKLSELCTKAADEYSGGFNLESKGLSVYWDTLKRESWAVGSRMVDCKVAAKQKNGNGFTPVTGSLRGLGNR